MKKTLFVLIGLFGLELKATDWRPCDAFLKAVRQVESSNGRHLYGDGGRSLGAYQLSEAAWIDVSAFRRERGLKTYSYRRYVMHSYINQAYAADYLSMLHGELSRKLRRAPNPAEVYAAYNMGLGNFAECNYRMARVNPVTAKKARQVHAYVTKAAG